MGGKVDILLATYNGGRFLSLLLDSIVAQTHSDWRLLVRDDGSNDDTLDIIKQFITMHGADIQIIDDGGIKLGACGSFAELMRYSGSEYIAFCDQDDCWRPEKLKLQLAAIKQLESVHGKAKPILVHTDLEVVDEKLDTLDESFWHYQNLKPAAMQHLERLLVQNCVTGCATMINGALKLRALPISERAIMHDWWLALVASACGVIAQLDITTVRYRQHGANQLGARQWGAAYILKLAMESGESYRQRLMATYQQAEGLLESVDLDEGSSQIVRRYTGIPGCGYMQKRIAVIKNGFLKMGLIRNLAYLFWL